MRLNMPIVGFLVGLFLPVLGFFFMFLIWRHGMSLGEFFHALMQDHKSMARVVLMGSLANLIPFAYTNMKRLDYAMRGIFVATMLYAVFILLLMFVWN